jgi:FAD:protein FMN transferase
MHDLMARDPAVDGEPLPAQAMVAPRRRQWLRLCLGLGGALLTPGASNAAAEKRAGINPLQWRERSLLGLGTTLWLRAAHASAERADAALDAAVAAIRHVETHMSLFEPKSAVCRLNRDGFLDDPHADLIQILRLAQQVAKRSGGTFDVTVQPLWATWSNAQKGGRLPTAAEVAAARARVGWRSLDVSARRIQFNKPGMALTLNGIAQGFAGDLARDALRQHGIEHALIDSGEWSPLGASPDQTPWALGIADPRQPGAMVAHLVTDGRAIATSSDVFCSFSADHVHHHIFDPRTGYSPRELASVTVLAPRGALADALTKVMFMGSAARAMDLAHQWQVDALVVEKSGRWRASPGLDKLLHA